MTQHIDNEEPLLTDVFIDEATEEFRRASLAKGLAVLERRRRHRKIAQVCLVAVLLATPAALLVKRAYHGSPTSGRYAPNSLVHASPSASLPDGFDQIGDRELLALFPNQTVALVGGPGQQRLLVLDKSQSPHSAVQ